MKKDTSRNRQKENRERQAGPATESSSSVSPGSVLSDIQVYIPLTTSHTVCVAVLAEAAPLAESHSIYLSPPYLSSKTIQAWTKRRREEEEGGSHLGRGNMAEEREFQTRQKCTCHSSEM